MGYKETKKSTGLLTLGAIWHAVAGRPVTCDRPPPPLDHAHLMRLTIVVCYTKKACETESPKKIHIFRLV